MSAPRKLQFWCRCRTAGYSGVSVEDMGASFRDGLAFCAIIHSFHPELIDFNSLKKENVFENNKLAFDVAEQVLGIPALLEPEDFVVMECPDRLSVLTYVSQYYHHFTGQGGNGVVKGTKGPLVASKTSKDSVEDAVTRQCPQISAGGACASCGKHVHLVQRYLVNGRLYHRNCFRCQKCSGTLLPGMYKEGSLPKTFVCTHHRESRVADLEPNSQQLDDIIIDSGDDDADKSGSKEELEDKKTEERNANEEHNIDIEKKAVERTRGQDNKDRLEVVEGLTEKENKENDLIGQELKPDTDDIELEVEGCNFKSETEARPAISITDCKNDKQPLHANGEIHDSSHHRDESEEHQHQHKAETVPCAPGCSSPAKVKPLPAPRRKSRPPGECGTIKGSPIPVPKPRQQAVPPLATEHPANAVAPKAPPWLALVPVESRKRPAPLPPGTKPNNVTQDISLTIEEPEKPLKTSTTDPVPQSRNLKCPAQSGNPFEGDNDNEDGAEESRDEIGEDTEGVSKRVSMEEFYNPFENDEGAENKEELRLADGTQTEEKQPEAENVASIIEAEKSGSEHVSDHPWYRMTPSPSESPQAHKRLAPPVPTGKHKGRTPPKTPAPCLPNSTEPTSTSLETATQSTGHLNNGTIDCQLKEVPTIQDGLCSGARPASAPGTTQRQSTPLPGEGLSPPRPASTPILTFLHLEPTSVFSASTPTLSSEPQRGTSTNLLSSLRPASTPTVSSTPHQEALSTLSSSHHHASTPAFLSPSLQPDPCPDASQPPPRPATSPARSPNVQPKSICKENPFDRKPPAPGKAKPAKGAKPKRPPAPGHGYPIIKRKVHAGQSVPQEEIEQELRLMQRRLELLENRGVEMEAVLRSAESDDEEPLMAEWFRLINDKRQLLRQESELVYMLKQQSLEEHQTDIEFELRRLFNKPEADRTEKDREREQHLLQDLVSTIEGRNAIVESMHEDKQREAEEDEAVEKISQKDLLKEGSPGTVRRKAKFKPLKMLKKVGGKKEKKIKESVLQ
uniref:MICAL-like protein 1 isoform X2 n=1 Tax=Myxine glutinosa TaxID=7769 RepID=UPI00358E0FD2